VIPNGCVFHRPRHGIVARGLPHGACRVGGDLVN
jgi:hypothetical protein